MHEMKFLLAGAPKKDSVWLHLDGSSQVGISLWRDGSLKRLEYPAFWLAPYLWLAKTVPLTGIKKPKLDGKFLRGLRRLALKDATQAVISQSHCLLAQSMCTLYGFQVLNGAPNIKFCLQGTLGRMIAVDYFSQQPFLFGITKAPCHKTVLL